MEAIRLWYRRPSGALGRGVAEVLEGAPVEAVAVGDLRELELAPARADDLYLVAKESSPSELGELTRLAVDRPAGCVVVIHGERDPLGLLRDRVIPVRRARIQTELRPAISAAFVSLQRHRIETRASRARHLRLRVRDALRVTFRDPVWTSERSSGSGASRMRSVTAISERVGVGRPHLSGLLSAQGVPISKIADGWLILQAVALNHLGGRSWKAVAGELGYRSPSGLYELFQRTLGAPPGKVELTSLEALEWYEGKLEGWLNPERSG